MNVCVVQCSLLNNLKLCFIGVCSYLEQFLRSFQFVRGEKMKILQKNNIETESNNTIRLILFLQSLS